MYESYFIDFVYSELKFKTKNAPPIQDAQDYILLTQYKYTIKDLKSIIKRLMLPKCKKTKKKDLMHFCTNILYLSFFIRKIQKVWRNHFIRNFNKTLGPSYRHFDKSTNVDDFLTTETIQEIDYYYYFSFKDIDNFIYTFHIVSIYSLLGKNMKTNPYNRKPFSNEIIELVKRRMIYNRILQKTNDFIEYIPKTATMEDRIHQLFHHMDHLGNYTSAQWYIQLSRGQIRTFIYELYEIWNYRAQLSREIKELICPPQGNPFVVLPRGFIQNYQNPRVAYTDNFLRNIGVIIMEKLSYSAHSNTNKNMGVLYILSALTLVSQPARNAMPWLYASVYHN